MKHKIRVVVLGILLALGLMACETNGNDSKYKGERNESNNENGNNILTEEKLRISEKVVGKNVEDEEVKLFAGPGEDYHSYGYIKKKEIKKVLKIEEKWAEVQLSKQRGYVKVENIKELCVDNIPRVVYRLEFDQNIKKYPTVYCYNKEIVLYDDATIYNDVKGNSIGKIKAGEKLRVLFKEKTGLATYDQVEIINQGEKYRYYVNHIDLFALDNPLINFENVKEQNAFVEYKDEKYYSTSGENVTQLPKNWKLIETFSINKREFEILAGIVNVIAFNDVNDEAIDATTGLLKFEEREFINSNIKSKTGSNLVSLVDFFFNGTLNFLQGAYKTMTLQIQLKECSGEKKIVIKTGIPIESTYAGKTMSLEELIVNYNNTFASMVNSSKKANEIIKSIYPNYDKNKKYHMQITFSDNTDGFGYYLVIDKEYNIYAVPIIHKGTSMMIYCEGQAVYDVTYDLSNCMIQIDKETANKILDILEENGMYIRNRKMIEDTYGVSEQNICDAIIKVSLFSWNWFWESSREIVDENDSIVQMLGDSEYSREYKRIKYEGINNIKDVFELAKKYYTEEIAKDLMIQKEWHEEENKLYMSEPDGIGGYLPDYYDVLIKKDKETQYTITIYEYWNGELMEEPYDVHYMYIDGYWVFDQVLCLQEEIPIYVIKNDETDSDMKLFVLNESWVTEGYDSVERWTSSYQTKFEKDGTVCQEGWRNKDIGTYEISEDGTHITAHFTKII